MTIADQFDDYKTQWKKILQFRPEFRTIDVAIRHAPTISIRQGTEYCASRWLAGKNSDSSSIGSLGLKEATMRLAYESGADREEAEAVVALVARLLPPCCNGTCTRQ